MADGINEETAGAVDSHDYDAPRAKCAPVILPKARPKPKPKASPPTKVMQAPSEVMARATEAADTVGNPNEASSSATSATKRRASDALSETLRRLRLHAASSSSGGPAADGLTPSTQAGQKPGHPKCLYYLWGDDGDKGKSDCIGNKQSRIVVHVFPNGKFGDIYCQECWNNVTSQDGKQSIKCQLLGHPRCTQFTAESSQGGADHICIGTEEDELVQHVHEGALLDVYCVTCWNEFKARPEWSQLQCARLSVAD